MPAMPDTHAVPPASPPPRAESRSAPAAPLGLPTGPERAQAEPIQDQQVREAQDLLFFAYRDFTNAADVVLEELGLGRAHHRALHFIGGNPGITVSDLLAILRITKQALARVLNALIEEDYVSQSPGSADRRQRLLTLTPKGAALERRLFKRQRDRLAPALTAADPASAAAFRTVMRAIMDDSARAYLDAAHPAAGRQGTDADGR